MSRPTALRALDDERYAQAQPNLFDADLSLAQLKDSIGRFDTRVRSA